MFLELDNWGPFQPKTILMDYELAIHNAVAEVLPSTVRRGCFFHHKKALLRHPQQFNLMEEYSVVVSPIRQCFAMVGAIAFVPEVDEIWMMLKPLLSPDMIEFTRYYEAAWIGSSGNRPTFAHDMWNQNTASRSLLPRSTNIAEGWHRGFNSMLGCSNPTIWKFLDCVKAEQSS